MTQAPDSQNPIVQYWEAIQSGREVVSRKVYKTMAKLIRQLREPGEYRYSPGRAQHVLDFAQRYCRQSKGKAGGKLVQLELWEKAILAATFGFVDGEGRRQYRELILIVGKKNGKSLLASVIGLYLLLADGERGPEVYAVATKRDQAKIIWTEAKRMVAKSAALRKRVRSLVGELACDANDGTFRPLASDSDTLDGLNVHGALLDEIHQWKSGRALYDIVADGTIAREQPLIVITSTAGVIREDIYDEKYEEVQRLIDGYDDPEGFHDPHLLAFVYELDKREEWLDPACWRKANPGLGTIKPLQALADKVQRAKENPRLQRNLLCKEFNLRQTSSQAWLSFEQLDCRDRFELDRENRRLRWIRETPQGPVERSLPYPTYGIGGADLSSTTDLTAAKVLFMVPGCDRIFTLSMYWLPEELLEKRAKEDNIHYDVWQQRGLLRVSPGNKVNYKDVTAWFVQVQQELDIYLPWIGYDAWSASYWRDEMTDYFGSEAMMPVIQGKKTLSDPMKRLGNDLESKLIVYNNNPIDKWCLSNTAADEDINGNIQPCKTSKATRRIDGFAALLDAYVILQQKQEDYLSLATREED